MFGKSVVRMLSPQLNAQADSIDFQIQQGLIIQKMDEHVERMADYAAEAEPILREVALGLRQRNRETMEREKHVDALARTILSLPPDQSLSRPAQKFAVVKNAAEEWRQRKRLSNDGVWAAAQLHKSFRSLSLNPPVSQGPGHVLGPRVVPSASTSTTGAIPRKAALNCPFMPSCSKNQASALSPEQEEINRRRRPTMARNNPVAKNLADLNQWGSLPNLPEVVVHNTGNQKYL